MKYALYILAIAIVLIAAYELLHLNGLATIVPTGVTVTGLGQVSVLSNWQGVSGPWWLASVALGGGQTLNVQNLGGAQYSASQLNTNSSYVCGTSCQNNNLQISAPQSYIRYLVSSAGTLINEYYIANLDNGQASITYETCAGAVIGSYQSTTISSGQLFEVPLCFEQSQNIQTAQNYATACKKFKGIPLAQYEGSNFAGCYQLNTVSYANVYGLAPEQPEYTVQVTLNGQSTSIDNNMSSNTTNPNIWLYNIGSGFSTQAAPSETTVSLVQYLPITGTAGFTQSVPSYTVQIEGNGGQGIVSAIGAYQNSLQGTFPQQTTYVAATQLINQTNLEITGSLHSSYVNTQFANSTIIYGSGGFFSTGGSVLGLKINDLPMLYTRPNIVLAIKASQVGLYLGVSKMNITSLSIGSFRSGSTSTAYVQVQNTGSAQGGYTVSFNAGESSSGISSTPAQQSGTLGTGSQQTLSFGINDNANINSNTTQSIAFTVCPQPQVSGGPACQTVVKSFTLVPQCQNNQQFNAGTCQTLTTITAPTTSIPQSQKNVSGGSSTATTTIPCNANVNATCVPPNQPSTDWTLIAIVLIIVVAIIIIAYFALKKGKK